MSVYFGFTADQLELRGGLREVLTGACEPTVVRAAWDGDPSPLPGLWKQLGEVGLWGLLVGEDDGGSAGTDVDLVLLLEECGRFAVPGPVGEHIAVVAPLLSEAGDPDTSRVLDGDLVGTASRTRTAVRWAPSADLVLLLGEDRAEVVRRPELGVGAVRSSVDRSMSAAEVTGEGAYLAALVPSASRRACLAVSAQLLGLADGMIAMAAEHVKGRTQFGVPIGSQQAVKHMLAQALVSLEHARPLVYRAGWASSVDASDADQAVSVAKIAGTRAARLAGRVALQCHGAIGYSWEHDLHLWLKRVWALETAWGTTAEHEERLAVVVLGPA